MGILTFIPDPIKQKIGQAVIDFLADQARDYASDQIADKISGFSSNSEWRKSFETAMKAAVKRFETEYILQDEDLVIAIKQDKEFWTSKKVLSALMDMIKRPGAWIPQEQQTFVQHFDDVLPQRLNRERVDAAVLYFLRCIVEELWTLPGTKEIREVYSLQFQKLTAEAATEQVALSQRQLLMTAQLGRDVRETLAQLTSALGEKMLTDSPQMPILPSPRPYHNLPQPDYAAFVGRKYELDWLRQRLSCQDRAWQIVLTGIGGVGKSALALAIAHEYQQCYDELPSEERFDAIVWISAKEEVLTVQGKESAGLTTTVLRTVEDIYIAIAHVLEREDIMRALPENQGNLVEKALRRQRTLLVLDNLESVKDERVKPFLRNLPAPTKAIITSREWLDVADVFPLTGLLWEEANQLIDEEAKVRGVDLKEQQRVRIFVLTFGLPLSIKLSIARMASGEIFEAVTRWLGDAVGDLPEYCLKGQIELASNRDPNTWGALLASSLFDREMGVSREALAKITDLSLADLDAALGQLQRLFLIKRNNNDRFCVLPIVQRYVRSQLVEDSVRNRIISRWLDWLAEFVRANSGDLEIRTEKVTEFGLEYPTLFSAICWCREQMDTVSLFRLTAGTWLYAYRISSFDQARDIADALLEAAHSAGDERYETSAELLLSRLALIYELYEQALQHVNRALELASATQDDFHIKLGWLVKASILLSQRQFAEAKALALQLIELLDTNEADAYIETRVCECLSTLEIEQGNFDQAQEWLQRAESIAEKINASRVVSTMQHRHGVILMRQGKYADAEPYLLRSLESNRLYGDRRYIAFNAECLANVYFHTGRFKIAYQLAEEAEDLFDRLGMTSRVDAMNELRGRLVDMETLSEDVP